MIRHHSLVCRCGIADFIVKSQVGFEQALPAFPTKHLQESKSLRQDLSVRDVKSNNVSWSILSICGMPNISGL